MPSARPVPLPWLRGCAPLEGSPLASASTPTALAQAQASSPPSSPTWLSAAVAGKQVRTVDVGEKVDHRPVLPEYIRFHCTLGRWISSSLWRTENWGPYISLAIALTWVLYFFGQSISQQTPGEYPDAVLGAGLERGVSPAPGLGWLMF